MIGRARINNTGYIKTGRRMISRFPAALRSFKRNAISPVIAGVNRSLQLRIENISGKLEGKSNFEKLGTVLKWAFYSPNYILDGLYREASKIAKFFDPMTLDFSFMPLAAADTGTGLHVFMPIRDKDKTSHILFQQGEAGSKKSPLPQEFLKLVQQYHAEKSNLEALEKEIGAYCVTKKIDATKEAVKKAISLEEHAELKKLVEKHTNCAKKIRGLHAEMALFLSKPSPVTEELNAVLDKVFTVLGINRGATLPEVKAAINNDERRKNLIQILQQDVTDQSLREFLSITSSLAALLVFKQERESERSMAYFAGIKKALGLGPEADTKAIIAAMEQITTSEGLMPFKEALDRAIETANQNTAHIKELLKIREAFEVYKSSITFTFDPAALALLGVDFTIVDTALVKIATRFIAKLTEQVKNGRISADDAKELAEKITREISSPEKQEELLFYLTALEEAKPLKERPVVDMGEVSENVRSAFDNAATQTVSNLIGMLRAGSINEEELNLAVGALSITTSPDHMKTLKKQIEDALAKISASHQAAQLVGKFDKRVSPLEDNPWEANEARILFGRDIVLALEKDPKHKEARTRAEEILALLRTLPEGTPNREEQIKKIEDLLAQPN